MIKITARLFCFATLALGISQAAPYDITVFDTVAVGSAQLKAGDYTVEMQGDKAVFTLKSTKKVTEIPATMAKSDSTFTSTVFISQHAKLKEIDLGGTQDKIVFATNVASK
jgi:hypothetical protein